MVILITGSAGFIGFHVCRRLLEQGHDVIGVDNLNSYYNIELKNNRNEQLVKHASFTFFKTDITNASGMRDIFERYQFNRVIHLAAQAGVRHSITHPEAYLHSNLLGYSTVLELCRQYKVEHFVYASSSSVYGANRCYPFSEDQAVGHPVSLYAATKRSNELMAHSYASLYDLPCTGLRFFTVYGPFGRPDMAPFKFAKKLLQGEVIDVYNYGDMFRDFTYIDDIVDGVLLSLYSKPEPHTDWDPEKPILSCSYAPFRIYNIGRGDCVNLLRFIEILSAALGVEPKINFLPTQVGDVYKTQADVSRLTQDLGYSPSVSVVDGVAKFVVWFKQYYATRELLDS